jgi:hypothetical protein
LTRGIEVNFARTTTGDGYYVWNRDLAPGSNEDLLHFLLLVVADNAMAREASKGNTVPEIRTAFHIGSHYELYQAEGVNPTVFSYIVGDVTIELARMVDLARPGQMFIGDFQVELPAAGEHKAGETVRLDTLAFLDRCNEDMARVLGVKISGQEVRKLECRASRASDGQGGERVRRFRLTDKHGLSRNAYNLELHIDTTRGSWALGLGGEELSAGSSDGGDVVDAKYLQQLKGPSRKSVSEDRG